MVDYIQQPRDNNLFPYIVLFKDENKMLLVIHFINQYQEHQSVTGSIKSFIWIPLIILSCPLFSYT